MKRSLWPLVGGLVLVAGVLAWFFLRHSAENVAIDLIDQFPTAVEKRPTPETFSVVDATLHGETKHSILVNPVLGSQIKYKLTVPDNAWLLIGLGLKEEAWTQQGDGVKYRILVVAGTTQDVVLTVRLDPFHNAGDREWKDQRIDLSEYAGETIELMLLTNASEGAQADTNGDFALWGAPRIVVK